MRLKIEYIVSEIIDIPSDIPTEIVQVIVEDAVDGAKEYLEQAGFLVGLKKIERKP